MANEIFKNLNSSSSKKKNDEDDIFRKVSRNSRMRSSQNGGSGVVSTPPSGRIGYEYRTEMPTVSSTVGSHLRDYGQFAGSRTEEEDEKKWYEKLLDQDEHINFWANVMDGEWLKKANDIYDTKLAEDQQAISDAAKAAYADKPATAWDVTRDTFNYGWTGISRGGASALDFLMPTEFLGKYDPFTYLSDDVKRANDYYKYKREAALEGKGTVAQVASDLGVTTIEALPTALSAIFTGGTSLMGQANTLSPYISTATSWLGRTFDSARTVVGNLLKNPAYYTSAAQTLGRDYEEAKADGASDAQAAVYAIISTGLNAGVEVASGIETMPKAIREGGKPLLQWLTSMPEEGFEEVVQRFISGTMQKAIYDPDKRVMAWNDDDAIISAVPMAKEFAMGTAVGGILGGGQVALGSAVDSINNKRLGKIGSNYTEVVDELIGEGLSFGEGFTAYNVAEELQTKMELGANPSNTDLGRLVSAIEQSKRTVARNTPPVDTASPVVETSAEASPVQSRVQTIQSRLVESGMEADRATAVATSIDRIISGDTTITGKDKDVLSVGNVAARAIFEEETGVKLPASNSSTRKAISEYVAQTAMKQPKQESTATVAENETVVSQPPVNVMSTESISQLKDDALNSVYTTNSSEVTLRQAAEVAAARSKVDNDIIAKSDMDSLGTNGQRAYAKHLGNAKSVSGYSNAFMRYYESGLIGGLRFESIKTAYDDEVDRVVAFEAFSAGQNDASVEDKGKPTIKQKNAQKGKKTPSMGKGRLYDSRTSEGRSVDEKTTAVLKQFAKVFNVDIELVDTIADRKGISIANGYYKDGKVVLAADSDNPLMTVLKHEVTHHIQKTSPKQYKAFKDYVMKAYYNNSQDAMNAEIQRRIDLAALNDVKLTRSGAMDEIVADATERFLTDRDSIDALVKENRSLAETILNAIRDVLKKIEAAMKGVEVKGLHSNFMNADQLKKAEKMWVEALADAAKGSEIGTNFAEITESSAPIWSLKSMKFDLLEGQMQRDLVEHGIMTVEESQNLMDNISNLIDNMSLHAHILDMNEEYSKDNRPFSVYKPNSDPLYKVSLDFSTLCKKRLMTQFVMESLQTKLGKALSAKEQLAIRSKLEEYGKINKQIQVACALCYVEARRLRAPDQINRFLDDRTTILTDYFGKKNKEYKASVNEMANRMKVDLGYKADTALKNMKPADKKKVREAKQKMMKQYVPSAEEQKIIERANAIENKEFLSQDGLTRLSLNDPVIYDSFVTHVRNATKSKALEGGVPYYYGDSKSVSDALIEAMNAENGLRHQSWSDFEIVHLLDNIAAVIELSVRKAKMHAYTKVPDFVHVNGNTGIMINLSLIPAGKNGMKDGILDFSPTEGMDYQVAVELRDQYHKTTGTIAIGIDDQQITMMLDDDTIDYVIPYHNSGMNAQLRKMAGISGWANYETFQSEKEIKGAQQGNCPDELWHKKPDFSEWFDTSKLDMSKSGVEIMREAAGRYLVMCEERGLKPKFSDTKKHTDFTKNENYWKLLIDRKMVDKDGNIIIQQAVRPDFDFDLINQVAAEEVANYDPTLLDSINKKISEEWENGGIKQREKELLAEEKREKKAKKKAAKVANGLLEQVVMPEGAQASFKGEKANLTAEEISDLRSAKAMKESGKSNEEIYKATGWYTQSDGKWRREIPDEIMIPQNFSRTGLQSAKDAEADKYLAKAENRLKSGAIDKETYDELVEFAEEVRNKDYDSGKLPVFLDAPKLYDAYPQLKKVSIRFEKLSGMQGYTDTGLNLIVLDPDGLHDVGQTVREGLAHEIQHIIQSIEGFERGSTPAESGGYEAYRKAGGEIEARDVEDRLRMDDEDRRSTMPNQFSFKDSDYLAAVERNDMATAQKMVDEAAKAAGYTIQAYHGTNADFTVFDKNRLGKGIDRYGAGFYFGNHKGISEAYGTKIIPTYLKIEKPITIRSTQFGNESLRDVKITKKQAAEILKKHPKMYTDESPLGDFYEEFWETGAKAWMIQDLASKYTHIGDLEGDFFGDYPNEFHKAVREAAGYDGVVVYIDYGNFTEEQSDYFYVAWFDNQMKSAEPVVKDDSGNVIPLSKRFNEENNDIRYSLKDSDGNTLTKEQAEFFKDSKVRDENGNLKVVYHGTPTGGFTVFDKSRNGKRGTFLSSRLGTYFTEDKQYAQSMSRSSKETNPTVYEAYLNIKEPLRVLTTEVWTEEDVREIEDQLAAGHYDGIVDELGNYVIFDSDQAKRTDNKNPTSDPDIRYSLKADTSWMDAESLKIVKDADLRNRYGTGIVSMTDDRLNKTFSDLEDHSPTTAHGYLAYIDPWDFLHMTTTSVNDFLDRAPNRLNEGVSEDWGTKNNITNPDAMYLRIDEDGRVVGHEGRHRMAALYREGYKKVAIQIRTDAVKNAKPIDIKTIKDQFDGRFSVGLFRLIPVSKEYREVNRELFGYIKSHPWDTPENLQYQLKTPDEMLDISKQIAEAEHEAKAVTTAGIMSQAVKDLKLTTEERTVIRNYQNAMKTLADYEKQLAVYEATKGEHGKGRSVYTDASGKTKKSGVKYSAAEKAEIQKKVEWWKRRLNEIEQKETFKKILKREKAKMAETHAQKMSDLREAYNKRLKDVRAKRDEKIEAEKQKMRDYKQHQRDSKEYKALKGKLEADVKWLDERLRHPTDAKHIPEDFKKGVAAFLKSLDFESEYTDRYEVRNGVPSQKVINLRAMREVYESILKDQSSTMELDETQLEALKELEKICANKRVADLDYGELGLVRDAIQYIRMTVAVADKAFNAEIKESISAMGEALIGELRSMKAKKDHAGILGEADKLINYDNVSPADKFHEFGGVMEKLYKQIRKGFDQHIKNVKTAISETQKLTEGNEAAIKEWSGDKAKTTKFQISDGTTIELTPAQVMSLYCLMKRDQAVGHVLGSGIVPSGVVVKEAKKFGKVKINTAKKISADRSSRCTLEDIQKIVSTLTDDQKKIADGVMKFFTTKCADWGNETSMKLYGYKKFLEPNYFPIRSSDAYLNARFDDSGDALIKNLGFTKNTVVNANNPIVVEDIFDVLADHTNKMSMYNALVVPLTDFTRVFNYKSKASDNTIYDSVQKALETSGGSLGIQYIKQFMKDVNKQANSLAAESFINKSISRYKKAKIAFSSRVLLQQPTAITRAADMVDPKYLIAGVKQKVNYDEMFSYSEIAYWKSLGFYQTDMSRNMRDILLDNESLLDRVTMGGYGKADDWAWGHLWNAIKLEQADAHPDMDTTSSEFMDLVKARFANVVDRTQVVDSVFHRSQIMRAQGAATKIATAFMAEPTKGFNLLRTDLIDSINSKDYGQFKRSVVTFVANAIVVSAFAGIADMIRDDDDEDEEGKKRNLWDKYRDATARNIVDNVNPMSMIPYIKEINSMLQGYDVNRMEMASIAEFVKTAKKWFSGKFSYPYLIKETAADISELFGVPLKNAVREVTSLVRTAGDIVGGHYYADYMVDKMKYNISNSANRSVFYKHYTDALLAGDQKAADAILADMVINGIPHENIISRGYQKQKEAAFSEARKLIAAGKTDEAKKTIRKLAKQYDKKYTTLWKAVRDGDSGDEPDETYTFNDFKRAVKKGKDTELIEDYLTEYGGYSEEDLEEAVKLLTGGK